MPADAASEDAASETDAPERPPAQAPPADDNGNASSRDASADEPLAGEPASARRRSPVEEADEQAEAWARLPFRLRKSVRTLTLACTGLLALAVFYTLYFASSLFLPIVIAVVLNMLFRPLVRGLRQRAGLPDPVGAAVVILVVLGIFAFGLYEVSGPASQWVEQAPRYLRSAEAELRGLFESLESVTKGAEAVGNIGNEGAEAGAPTPEPQPVQVQGRSAVDVLLSQTRAFLVSAAVVFFLLYFLLASGDLFLRKLVRVVPLFRQKRVAVQIARSAESDLSTYLATYTVINAVLGTVVGTILYLLGMPNPALWGVMVGLLNFVPYLGAAVGVSVVALVAFVSIEPMARALMAPLLYFIINALEGNLVTPMVLGRRLQLNPVAIFISLTFWYWIWGFAGALLATPLLVMLKVVCDNVVTLRALGEFIGR
ncbi:MAG: AI-2E family transporter [Bacteroidetes bacterium QS_7_67_15]|nr:MAG: AI-2E family transporter [Bacteroidetes bacterium QS_7_67_15]